MTIRAKNLFRIDQVAGIAISNERLIPNDSSNSIPKEIGWSGWNSNVVVKPSSDTFLLFFMNSFSHNFHHFMF